MARGGEMQAVELDDAPDVAPDEADDRPRRVRWRRPLIAAGIVVLVGGALAGGQWVVDARESSAIAALAGIPGVIAPIDGDLEVLGTASSAQLGDQLGGSGEVTSAADGSQAVQWYDPETGSTLWTAPLLGPTPKLAHEEGEDQSVIVGTHCQLGGRADEDDDTSAASRVVCLVSDGGEQIGDDYMGTPLPITATRIVVLDAADGSVVVDQPVDAARSFTVVPGLAVVAGLEDGAPVVTAYDVETGERSWRRELSATRQQSEDEAMGWNDAFVASIGTRILVQSPVNRFTLLASDGRMLRDLDLPGDQSVDSWWVDARTDRLLYSKGGRGGLGSSTLVTDDDDPSKDLELAGTRVYVTVDDGSLPGLVLTGGSGLRAWDAASGTATWSAETAVGSGVDQAMVLRGDVFATSANLLVAVDGSTGEELWTHTLDTSMIVTRLFTDGRRVFVVLEGAEGDVPALAAYDRTSGEEAFSVDYPAGIDQVYPGVDGRLIGHESATDRYVVLG